MEELDPNFVPDSWLSDMTISPHHLRLRRASGTLKYFMSKQVRPYVVPTNTKKNNAWEGECLVLG